MAQNPPEHVGTQSSDLMSGSINVSDGLLPGRSLDEQETSSVTLDYPPGTTLGLAVAYNADDRTHMSGNSSCAGITASAISYYTNGSFRALRFPTPSGIAALVGDPAAVVGVIQGAWLVFVTSLSISTTAWNNAGGGCLASPPEPDGACLNAVVIPVGGGPAVTLGNTLCYQAQGGGGLDGSSSYWSPATGYVYTAHWNTHTNTADVYKNGVPIADPLYPLGGSGTLGVIGHPLFATTGAFDTIPTLIIPTSITGGFFLSRYDEQHNTWTPSALTTTGSPPYSWAEQTQIIGGPLVRNRGYTADYYQEQSGGTDNMWFFYRTKRSYFGTTRLQGVQCSFSGLNTIGCSTLPNALTTAGADAFMPALASVNVTGRATDNGYRPWLSYWTDSPSNPGNVMMIMARVSLADGRLTPYPLGNTIEAPCPIPGGDQGNYWGDYDSMNVYNNGSSQPTLLRYLTDSTDSVCNGGGIPQHVSLVLGNGSL